jgi:hypothetical protein
MTGKVKLIVGAIALALLAALTQPAEAADEPPYPVWWSPVLELESLDAIDARLERLIWPDDPEGLPLMKTEGDTRKEVSAPNCVELERLVGEGYEGIGSHGFGLQLYHQAFRRAIEMMRRARPAERSFLQDFVLDEDAIHYLPAMSRISMSCDFLCRQRVANERHIPLSHFEPVVRVDVASTEEIVIWTLDWKTIFTVLGRGDFNRDGLDDLLVLVRGGPMSGTWGGAELHLLSRDSPGGVLAVVEEATDSCGDYQCNAAYDYPRVLRDTDPAFAGTADRIAKPRPITFGVIAGEDYASDFLPPDEGPPYPVWWWPLLGVERLADIDALLTRSFWLTSEGTMLEIESAGQMVEVPAKSCRTLLKMLERGYRLTPAYRSHVSVIATCRALRMLKQARPAEASHLRDLVLDETVIEVLPALLGFWTSPCAACRSQTFNETRQSWARFAAERAAKGQIPRFQDGSAYETEILDERKLRVRTPAWTVEVQVLAGGDFNGDGLDDILVQRDVIAEAPASALYVLSRSNPREVLWVVNTDEFATSTDECDDCREETE